MHGKRLVDWECGNRDHLTLERLLKRLNHWSPLFYCTDHYEAYAKLIPPHRLFMGKDKTVEIEQNNGAQRHWFARFRRKSIVVSKSQEMVDITMAIFTAVHVNKVCSINTLFS